MFWYYISIFAIYLLLVKQFTVEGQQHTDLTCDELIVQRNFLPELYWGNIDYSDLSPEEYRQMVLDSESKIRVPSLLDTDRLGVFDSYQRNGYQIIGYEIPENGSQVVFNREEEIAIRAYLAAQYMHQSVQFFDIEKAKENDFFIETEDFFNPGDIMILIINHDGQIVSHLGIEGPLTDREVNIKDMDSRDSLHYVEEVYQRADGTPMLHGLLSDDVLVNDTREIRRFAIRHKIDNLGFKQNQREKIMLSLETIVGMTRAIPILLDYEERTGRNIHFILDTDANIVRLSINGLLGIIPKSGEYVPFVSSLYEGNSVFLPDEFISLDGLELPYREILKTRYKPRGKEIVRAVNLNVFTLHDVIVGLDRSANEQDSRLDNIISILESYATSKIDADKDAYFQAVLDFFGSYKPIFSELLKFHEKPKALMSTLSSGRRH